MRTSRTDAWPGSAGPTTAPGAWARAGTGSPVAKHLTAFDDRQGFRGRSPSRSARRKSSAASGCLRKQSEDLTTGGARARRRQLPCHRPILALPSLGSIQLMVSGTIDNRCRSTRGCRQSSLHRVYPIPGRLRKARFAASRFKELDNACCPGLRDKTGGDKNHTDARNYDPECAQRTSFFTNGSDPPLKVRKPSVARIDLGGGCAEDPAVMSIVQFRHWEMREAMRGPRAIPIGRRENDYDAPGHAGSRRGKDGPTTWPAEPPDEGARHVVPSSLLTLRPNNRKAVRRLRFDSSTMRQADNVSAVIVGYIRCRDAHRLPTIHRGMRGILSVAFASTS